MSARRVRFPAASEIPAPADPVPSIGPVAFSLRFGGTAVHFDLSHLPCPRLVRPLAAALSQIGGDDGTMGGKDSFRGAIRAVRLFAEFVAAAWTSRRLRPGRPRT